MRSRWIRAIGAVAPSCALLAGAGTIPTGVKLGLVAVASAATLDLVRREARAPGGSPQPIVWCGALLLMVAVITPPRFSHDIWSYAIVGRIATVHHANPYLHAAGTYRHDRFLALVGEEWRHGTTPYGPLFVLYAAAVAFVGGAHPLLYRLAFQGTAALAVGAALLVLWRATRNTSALALVGLLPVIACSVVNGGHNDAPIGLGLLLAVLAARRAGYAASGWWIAAAVLVKATAGLALAPLVAWAWARGGRRAAGVIAAPTLLVAVPAMLTTPGMLRSLRDAETTVITRASVWNLPFRLLPRLVPSVRALTAVRLVTLASVSVLVLVVVAAWVARRVRDPAGGVVAAMATWLVCGAYVMPWYSIWALPTAALRTRSRLAWLVAIQGVAVTAAFVVPRSALSGGSVASDLVRIATPTALVALFAWAARPMLHRSRAAAGLDDPSRLAAHTSALNR